MAEHVDAPIVAVTVYPGGARITRRGRVTLPAGEQRVLAGGLPLGLRPESVRVSGRGPAAVLGVDVLVDRHPRSPDSLIAELTQRQQDLETRLAELDDADSVQATRAELLRRLANRSGGALARALATEAVDPARVAVVGDALADQLGAVLTRRRELAQQRRTVEEDYEEVIRSLGDRLGQQAPDRMAIAADLDVAGEAGAEVELEISYLVDDARWESRYDVRLRDDTLAVTWFGFVTQNTGEDWPECELGLSTARPASAVTVPELDPWFLDIFRPPPPAMPMVERARMSDQQDSYAMPLAAAAAGGMPPHPPPPMVQAQATAEHGVAATTYRPGRPVAVPSDGTAHRTTITVADLPARVDHVTVPVRGPEAYLRATVTNITEHTLRPGRASIFHGNEFVGTTSLDPWAPGEEVELTLGVDDRVRVERELVRRSASKAVIGGTKRREVEYRIEVANYGPAPARVTVIDQVPVSRNESIAVRDVQLNPNPAETTELGELTWRLALPPGAKQIITVGFRVDVNKAVEIAGWRD